MEEFKIYQASGLLTSLVHEASDVIGIPKRKRGPSVQYYSNNTDTVDKIEIEVYSDPDSALWNEINLIHSSDNLYTDSLIQGYWAYADGNYVGDQVWVTTNKVPCEPNTTYYAAADYRTTRWQGFVWFDENDNYISTNNSQGSAPIGYSATSPANAKYLIYNIAGRTQYAQIHPEDVINFGLYKNYSKYNIVFPNNITPVHNGIVTISDTGETTLNVNGTEIPLTSTPVISNYIGVNIFSADSGDITVYYFN